jgi:hypothetical protein
MKLKAAELPAALDTPSTMLSSPIRLVSLVGPVMPPLHLRLDKNARSVLLHDLWRLLTAMALTALSLARPGPGRT